MLPQKILKFRVLLVHSGAVLVYTSELRVHLTSADTRALTARASRIVSWSQRHEDRAKKERAPLIEPRPPALKGAGPSNTRI